VEDVALAPALEHALLERGEGLRRVDGSVAGHAVIDSTSAVPRVAVLHLHAHAKDRGPLAVAALIDPLEPRLYCPLQVTLARGGGSTSYGTRFPKLRFVNGLPAHPRACAALLMAVTLAVLPGALAAQEPPPVVPDSAPVAPDPAPIAPDPAPASPDSGSQPAPEAPAPAPPRQSFEPQPASTPVPRTAATPSESVRNPKRTRVRENRTRDVARHPAGSRRAESARERPSSSSSVKAAVSPLRGIDSDSRSGQLMAAGLALLVLVLLSGAFLNFVSPLVRGRELQRP
jgi:hypothetical protein